MTSAVDTQNSLSCLQCRKSASHSFILDSTTAKNRCQDLRRFAEIWRRCRPGGTDRRDRRFRWKAPRQLCDLYNKRSQQDCPKLWRRKRLGQERTALPGIRRQPCGGHVPIDAKKPRGNCYVRQRGRRFPGVVRQTAGPQQHKAVNTNEQSKKTTKKDEPMLNKGARKGKSKGKARKRKSKGKGKGKGKSNNCRKRHLAKRLLGNR